ncbi:GNAT family N-acetyltransferase [Chromobacterium fluminis]|nr:GNAT family N-acetyltransferase [Chromobacterium haemolyticum]
MVDIRTMRAEDALAVARLCLDLGYEATEAEISERFVGLTALPDNQVWVAERDGVVFGWAHCRGVHSLQTPPAVEIVGIVVSQACQRQGLGQRLLSACEAWALQRGYEAIRLRSNIKRVEAHAFYRHLGYQQLKTSHSFSLDLRDRQ